MKTLTITDAKKNLGRWLQAAAHGEDIGVISGADIIALRKVEVTPVVDEYAYAMHEYGVSGEDMKRVEKAVDRRYDRLKRHRKLVTMTPSELKERVEKASHD